MRIRIMTLLFITLALTSGVVNADLRSACLSNCALNKRSCADGCPPPFSFTEYDRTQCLKDCRETFISCHDSCPQPEAATSPSSSPSPNSTSDESYSAKNADKGTFNEPSK
jgi:hypothetical protein